MLAIHRLAKILESYQAIRFQTLIGVIISTWPLTAMINLARGFPPLLKLKAFVWPDFRIASRVKSVTGSASLRQSGQASQAQNVTGPASRFCRRCVTGNASQGCCVASWRASRWKHFAKAASHWWRGSITPGCQFFTVAVSLLLQEVDGKRRGRASESVTVWRSSRWAASRSTKEVVFH